MNNKIYKKLFVGFGFVSIVLILTLFVMSQTYIQNLVYHERLSQMEEVTHQMFHSLEDVIDNHWDEVDVQCNYLYNTPLETDTDLYRYLKKLSELSNYHEKQIELIAVDAAGRYYTEYGRTGLLREMNYLENAPQRVSYVSNSLTVDDSRMVFLEQLSTPITLQSGEKEITLRYFGIAQSMTQLNDYFRCDAYENNNSVYVLDNNGFKLFNANDTELLKGHNVYTVLSQMSYLHGSSFAVAKERLARTGSCYSNAVLDGTEYYYARRFVSFSARSSRCCFSRRRNKPAMTAMIENTVAKPTITAMTILTSFCVFTATYSAGTRNASVHWAFSICFRA